jgi:hypothetical protein
MKGILDDQRGSCVKELSPNCKNLSMRRDLVALGVLNSSYLNPESHPHFSSPETRDVQSPAV